MSDFPSEDFRMVPKDSEAFGNIRKDSESFRAVQNVSERRSDHTLTVREVARMFEAAGVPRTERSITNWCQANKTGIARLDASFDLNARKYFITVQSVEVAIQEELSRERANAKTAVNASEERGSTNVPNASETSSRATDTNEVEGLRQEVVDLKIVNYGKDHIIKRLTEERENFAEERRGYVEKLMAFSRDIGQLETRLGIEAPMRRLDVIEGTDFRKGSEEADSARMFPES